MKLRLPHRLHAALVAALASVSFTTLCSGALTAAFFLGSQAFAEEAADNPGATIDIGDTNLDAQAAIDEEEGKGEAKEPGSAPINQAGFNGIRGSSDDFDRQSTAATAATEASIDTENVGTADQANYGSTSADLPSNDLGFTSNSYANGTESSSSDSVFQVTATPATAVPAVQQVQYVESTTPTTSSGTTTTGAATGGYSATPVSGATGGGNVTPGQRFSLFSLGSTLGSPMDSSSFSNSPALTAAVASVAAPLMGAAGEQNQANPIIPVYIADWEGYDASTGVATLGNTGTVINHGEFNQPNQDWNSNWNFLIVVKASTLTANTTYNLITTTLFQNNKDGYINGAQMTVSADGTTATIINQGWKQTNTSGEQTISLIDVATLTFVMSREGGKKGNVVLRGYADSNFEEAVVSAVVTGVNLSFNAKIRQVNVGALDGLGPHQNVDKEVYQVSDDSIGAFGVTKAGYNLDATLTAADLKAFYDSAGWLTWAGDSTNHTWANNSATPWTGGTFTSGISVVFNAAAQEHNVLIQSAITANSVKVRDNYTFNLSGDASLSASAIEIASGSSLTVNGGTVTTGGLSGAGALIKTGDGTMTVNSKIGSDYTGSISVSGGTLNIANGADGNYHEVTVTNGGVVDLKGKPNTDYMLHYTLNGGTLTNTGSGTSNSKIQNDQITLTGNSTISGSGNFCMLGSGYGKTELHLDTHTLEKTGTNEITMYSTVVSGGGTLKITNGSLNIKRNGDNNPMSSVNANIVLNRTGAESLKGNFNLAANYSISSTVENAIMSANVALQGATTLEAGESHSLTMSGALTGSGSITKTGEGTVTLTNTGNSYTGTTTVDGGTLSVAKLGGGAVSVTAGTLDLTATMTTGNLTVGNGATLKLAAGASSLTVDGDLTLNSGSELDVSRLNSLYAADTSITLVTYTGTGTSEGVALTGLGTGRSAYLTNDTTNKALILTFVATLDWNGTETNHTWVADSGAAWQGGTVFQNGAGVSFSSSTANKEVLIESAIVAGTVTVSEDGYRFAMGSGGSLTADNLYIADNKTLTTTGDLTIRNAMGGEGNNGNLTYAGEGPGTITFQSNDGEHVKEYTGTFTNESQSAVTLRFPQSTKSKTFEIHFDIKRAEGAGVVNLDLLKGTQSEADLSVFSSSVEVNDIKHTPNVTVLVREEGALTVTGTVTTGRLVVGQEDTETDAVFTLAGTNAKLNTGGTGSTFGAFVQGYGTLALTEGATETLSGGLLGFHGTYKASGENSVLTLSNAVASDAKLVAADGGVIKLTATYTMGDNSSVDGGTISVGNGLVVNGTVDLSKGTLAQTGGTVTVNQDKSLTLGNASIISAISNSGSVTFTQNITATGLTGGEKDYHVGIDGQKTTGDNYFAGAKEAYLNVVSGNGTVTIQNAPTVTQGGEVYTLGADGTASRTTQEADYTTFYHGSGALNLSDIAAAAKAHTATLARVNMSDDTVLTINDTVATIAVQEFDSAAKAIGTVSLTSEEPDIDKGQSRLLLDGYGTFEIQGTAEVDNAVRFVAGENSTVQIFNMDEDASSDQYKLDSVHIYVSAATVQKVGDGNVTVGNLLYGVSKVENTEASGSFTLAQSGYLVDDAALNVKARNGDIQFLNMSTSASANLGNLEIGADRTVGFYHDNVIAVQNEISVTVNGTLTAGAGAKLNANVDMASGSHLDVSGAQSTMGLLMGSDVILHSGSYLDIAGCTQEDVSGYLYNYLSSGEHSLYYLYSGTAEDKIYLSINGTQRIDPLTKRSWNDYDMDASTIYANLQAQTFYLVYDGANVGMIVAIGLIPEPATSTLSLLALAALAARRRRK